MIYELLINVPRYVNVFKKLQIYQAEIRPDFKLIKSSDNFSTAIFLSRFMMLNCKCYVKRLMLAKSMKKYKRNV